MKESLLARRPRLIAGLVLGAAMIALWLHAYSYLFISDDAYISFRYAYNFAYHGQLVFNLGEPVEGYTNFLWTALLGLLLKAGLRMEVMSQLLGGLFGASVLVSLYLLSRLYRGGRRTPWEFLAALLLPAIGAFAVWCSGGLETQLFAALVLGGVTAYIAESAGRLQRPYSAMLFALAAMTRPEGLLFFGLTGLHRLAVNILGERRLLPRASEVAWVVAFIVPFGLFFLWRYDYYGYPFPNTFYVKAGGDHWLMLRKWGLPYLWDFVHLNRLYLFLPFLLLLWPRTTWKRGQSKELAAVDRPSEPTPADDWLAREKGQGVAEQDSSVAGAPADGQEGGGEDEQEKKLPAERGEELLGADDTPPAAGVRPLFVWSYVALLLVTFVSYVCYVGGDFMAMGRFFLPVLPLFLFAAQEGLREALERPRRAPDSWRPSRFFPALVILLGVFVANSVWLHRENKKMRYHRWGLDTIGYLRKFADDRIKVGRWLRKHVPKDTYLSVGGAGAIVYASRLKALDTFGLNDGWIAHKGPRRGDRPGHSKFAPDWYIRKQKPDLMCHRARHQDWYFRPNAREAAHWRSRGYEWVCVDAKGLRPSHYCCLKRLDRDLGVWPAKGKGR